MHRRTQKEDTDLFVSLTMSTLKNRSKNASDTPPTCAMQTNTSPYSPPLFPHTPLIHSFSPTSYENRQAASWTGRRNADLITDPATGTTYFLGGALADGSSTNEVDAYKDGQWTASLPLTPASGVTTLNQFSSGSAILYNSKIFIFGGFSSTVGQRGYQNFQSLPYIDVSNPAAPTHGIQLTLGTYPQPRQDHCTVLTDSKKVLLFGGYDANAKTSLSDLWSLDMITMTWTQIISTNPTTPRHAHTCNIAGANMIVFGGTFSFLDCYLFFSLFSATLAIIYYILP